jgi:hypothetical protein
MDFMDYGTIALAALMIWLLYKVTVETREFIAAERHRALDAAPAPAPAASYAPVSKVARRRAA